MGAAAVKGRRGCFCPLASVQMGVLLLAAGDQGGDDGEHRVQEAEPLALLRVPEQCGGQEVLQQEQPQQQPHVEAVPSTAPPAQKLLLPLELQAKGPECSIPAPHRAVQHS